MKRPVEPLSILNSGLPDDGYDYLFVHDLIGHLSPDGMETALQEIMRIVRTEAWIHCHNVADIECHEIRPFLMYFKNRLSMRRRHLKKLWSVRTKSQP